MGVNFRENDTEGLRKKGPNLRELTPQHLLTFYSKNAAFI